MKPLLLLICLIPAWVWGQASVSIGVFTEITPTPSFSEMKKLAEHGDAVGEYQLGVAYLNGTGVQKDVNKALDWLNKSSGLNNVAADLQLARIYQGWDGIEPDSQKTYWFYLLAADLGNSEAEYWMGTYSLKFKIRINDWAPEKYDYSGALAWFNKAAMQGNLDAVCQMASLYESGKLGSVDKESALKFYKMAADHGNEQAKTKVKLLSQELESEKTMKESVPSSNNFDELFAHANSDEINQALHNVINHWSTMVGAGTVPENQEKFSRWQDDLINSPNDSIKFNHTLFTLGHSYSENLIEFMMAANWLIQIAPKSEFKTTCKKCFAISFNVKGPVNYRTPCNEKWRKIMSKTLIKYYSD